MIRVANIKLSLEEKPQALLGKISKKLKVRKQEILTYRICRESVDARKSNMMYLVYTVDVTLAEEKRVWAQNKDQDVTLTPALAYEEVPMGPGVLRHPPVIMGLGPAGLFAGLLLAQRGYRPLLLERGADVDTRVQAVQKFWQQGMLDSNCNVQFGEGGAGTFSDGKLTTLIKDKRCQRVLQELVDAGAPEEILYSFQPHVGTDRLRQVVKALREKIIALGGEVRWNSRVTDIHGEQQEAYPGGKLAGVTVQVLGQGLERIPAQVLIAAMGHSARDIFTLFYEKGVRMEPKAFSLGFRLEHPQNLIDRAQYKQFAGHSRLGPAAYKLAHHSASGRSAYTFCMCPGGMVVAAASEPQGVVTNGMSLYARDGDNANSALLVGVGPGDFGSSHPLAGIAFQRQWEQKAFVLGGSDYGAPIQLLGDFLADRPSQKLGFVQPTYPRPVVLGELKHCLPAYVVDTLREAIPAMARKLKGFDLPEALCTGVETRSSSPVRICRDERCCASLEGLYPAGEGAGYAGGIVSAAVDGMRVAEQIIRAYGRP